MSEERMMVGGAVVLTTLGGGASVGYVAGAAEAVGDIEETFELLSRLVDRSLDWGNVRGAVP